MPIAEPEIVKEDILLLQDEDFAAHNVCIVTGAGSGIGRAIAVAASANALTVVGLDISQLGGERTQELCRCMGGHMVFVRTDLTRDEDIENAVAEAANQGAIKYLANVAGIQHIDSLESFPMEKYDLMQRIMLRAPFYLSRLTIAHMKRNGDGTGAIGNMASIHAHFCTTHKSAYNVVKFGLRGLTQSIAAEGQGKIRSFSVSTGYVQTSLTLGQIGPTAARRGVTEGAVVQDVMLGRSRIKTMMSPIEVANLFVFGFSRHSRYLVGGDLLFDGGIVLTY